jgi:hypothetical protein
MFIQIEPPHTLSDRIPTVYVPVTEEQLDALAWGERLKKGAVTSEEVFLDVLFHNDDPQTTKGRELLSQKINEQVAQELVELLNFLQPYVGKEIHTESEFRLVDLIPTEEDD